jgi:hypothetical protein
MFVEMQITRNLAICEALPDELDHVLFPICEQSKSARVEQASEGLPHEGVEHLRQLGAVGPDLAVVDTLDTSAKALEFSLPSAEYAPGTGTESRHDEMRFVAVKEKYRLDAREVLLKRLQD